MLYELVCSLLLFVVRSRTGGTGSQSSYLHHHFCTVSLSSFLRSFSCLCLHILCRLICMFCPSFRTSHISSCFALVLFCFNFFAPYEFRSLILDLFASSFLLHLWYNQSGHSPLVCVLENCVLHRMQFSVPPCNYQFGSKRAAHDAECGTSM